MSPYNSAVSANLRPGARLRSNVIHSAASFLSLLAPGFRLLGSMRFSIRIPLFTPSFLLTLSLSSSCSSPQPPDGGTGVGLATGGATSTGGAWDAAGGATSSGTGAALGAGGQWSSGGTLPSGGDGPGVGGGLDGSGGTAETGGAPATGGSADQAYDCGDPEALKPTTFDMIHKCIIQPGCARSTCHDGEVPLLLIDTWEDFPRKPEHSAYDTLEQTLLNHHVERCYGWPLVTPSVPEESALLMALSGTCDDPEDPDWIMPQGCRTVDRCAPPEYIELIADWIRNGAPMP